MNSKIIRTVNGHYADPKSTRDLSNVTEDELDHIRMTCEAGRLEAETYLAMDDDELRATLERNIRVISEAGMCLPFEVPEINEELRQFLRVRCIACSTFRRKLNKSRNGAILGIAPLEYEHLVTSLQAGYREAEVFCTFTNEAIGDTITAIDKVCVRLGHRFENPYGGHCRDYVEFFQERAEILWDVLRCVNQPY
ncbi:MAG: hypothetical protein RLZZ519_3006 [Bacteroidota bacterium]|jgi:hypothetical protein